MENTQRAEVWRTADLHPRLVHQRFDMKKKWGKTENYELAGALSSGEKKAFHRAKLKQVLFIDT